MIIDTRKILWLTRKKDWQKLRIVVQYDADRDMIIYRDIFGDIEYILAHFYAVELN